MEIFNKHDNIVKYQDLLVSSNWQYHHIWTPA